MNVRVNVEPMLRFVAEVVIRFARDYESFRKGTALRRSRDVACDPMNLEAHLIIGACVPQVDDNPSITQLVSILSGHQTLLVSVSAMSRRVNWNDCEFKALFRFCKHQKRGPASKPP
jgi:hypothetical protein